MPLFFAVTVAAHICWAAFSGLQDAGSLSKEVNPQQGKQC